MINNTITLAKQQLALHAQQGPASKLSIYEVAHLMDTIHSMSSLTQSSGNSIFFQFCAN